MNFLKNHAGIAGALIVGGAVVVGAFIVSRDISLPVAEQVVASPTEALHKEIIEKDSDGDGLLDWEEELWGTNPFLADTDGDGILDGDYVRNRAQGKTIEEVVDFEDLNFTQQFSREFFGLFLEARSDGVISPVERDQLVASLLSNIDATLPKEHRASLVATTPTNAQSVAIYVQTLAGLIVEASPSDITESEIILLEQGLQEGNREKIEGVARIAEGYTVLAESILSLPAPEELRGAHAELITATSRLAVIIESFGKAFDDTLLALAYLPEYEMEGGRLLNAIEQIGFTADIYLPQPDEQTLRALEALGL